MTAKIEERVPEAAPVLPRRRIDAIDALRGFALLGVLAINLHTEFRVTLFEQFLPAPAQGSALDQAVAAFLSLAFEFKAFAIFSLLFGVGLAIQFERLGTNPRRPTLLARRLFALLIFGLIHIFLIWNGDILTEYAIAGLLILPLLYAPMSALLIGAALLLLAYLFMGWLPLPLSFPDSPWLNLHVAEARQVYGHGSFGQVAAFRVAEIPQITKLLLYVLPRTMGLMLLGAWAWRVGLLAKLAERARLLRISSAVLIVAGSLLTLEQYGYTSLMRGLGIPESLVGAIAPIALALGYAALLLGLSSAPGLRPLFAWMAPVGRMAFTNYIMQSVILALLFYGFGLGLMGRVGAAAGFGIALTIFSAQSWASAWWLERHRFGPLEWLWRTLMYGERQPWRRSGPAQSGA